MPLARIQAAVAAGRYFIHPHAHDRMNQRGVTVHDMEHAVANAEKIEPYEDDDSAWRVLGEDLDGDELTVGVVLATDPLGDSVLVITVF